MDNHFSHGYFSLWHGAKEILADFPTATVSELDIVNERVEGLYDAAVDSIDEKSYRFTEQILLSHYPADTEWICPLESRKAEMV